jgi:outer membrane murein-binding lipoprotein Lpp
MKRLSLAFAVACTVLLLTGCAALSNFITGAASAVQTACAGLETLKADAQANVKGGAANTVSNLASYVDSGCADAQKIAAIASDPATLQWLADMSGQLKALIAIAKGDSPAPAPAPAALRRG